MGELLVASLVNSLRIDRFVELFVGSIMRCSVLEHSFQELGSAEVNSPTQFEKVFSPYWMSVLENSVSKQERCDFLSDSLKVERGLL